MALNTAKRLEALRARRTGQTLAQDSLLKALGGVPKRERYQERSNAETTQYVLGAMQEVDPDYTANSFKEGNRVQEQLRSGLTTRGKPVSFEYQGSVPLNIHIRNVSDVDFLVLPTTYQMVDWAGPAANTYIRLGGTIVDDLMELRGDCESILTSSYPSATVDKSGAKSINISDGSLHRKIDVVPACWHDTAQYQAMKLKVNREVAILDKSVPTTISNRPFLYMAQIEKHDGAAEGNSKKVIRLLKTLRGDSDEKVTLSSYDIGSLVWHMDAARLKAPWYREIGLVAPTLEFFQQLSGNRQIAEALWTPDGSRKIVDDASKFTSIQKLARDLSEIAIAIAGEVQPAFRMYPSMYPDAAKILSEAYIP